MLQTLNSNLVSLGYEPVDAIVKDNYQLWYELALKKDVPSVVLDVIFQENNISTDLAVMRLTKERSVDSLSFIHNDNTPVIANTNDANKGFLDTLLSYHSELSIALGASSVSVQEGVLNYHFGKTAIKMAKIPLGVSGIRALSVEAPISVECKTELVALVQKIMQSSRPLVVILGDNKEKRAKYLLSLLLSQGQSAKIACSSTINDDFFSAPPSGYTIATFEFSAFSDFLTLKFKGDKNKSDSLSQLWNSSSSELILPELCPSCSIDAPQSPLSVPSKGFSLAACDSKVRNTSGCNSCFKGYCGTHSVYESFSAVTQSNMIELISEIGISDMAKSEYSKVQSSFSSSGIVSIYGYLEKLIPVGKVSVADVERAVL